MTIRRVAPETLALLDSHGGERLRYDRGSAPRPFVHPVKLADGTTVTATEPDDHFWHRGVWFTFKYVNGVNYWEEREDQPGGVGRQVSLTPPEAEIEGGDAVVLRHALRWEDDAGPKLIEARTLRVSERDDVLILDWESALTPLEDLTLDRTPFTTWGGYGGLVVRMRQDLTNQRIVFPGGQITNRPTGERHAWGGIEGEAEGRELAVAFLPHPKNRRYPEPFYGAAREGWNFFGGAPPFHEPLTLQAGETLLHRARVLILPRRISETEVNSYGTI